MIAKLRGLLDAKSEDGVIVDVAGVGYLVFCGTRTVQELPGIGEAVELYVETHVREDHIHLFGFRSRTEQQWFRLLLTVQGVGAKVALALLSTLTPAALGQALAAQDKAAVGRTPGIGPKLAQRIVSELKDKAPTLGIAPQPVAAGATQGGVAVAEGDGEGRAEAEALSALANLGYGRSDAHAAIGRARGSLGDAAGVEDLIREALRELAKG